MSKLIQIIIALSLTGCVGVLGSPSVSTSSSNSSSNSAAGNGDQYSGTGNLGVPTADAVVIRIQNGMENNVNALAGNFKTSLALVRGNLPKVTDPTKATGFDQVQLLVYAACADLSAKAQTVYNVNLNSSISTNQQNLIAAGVRMLDRYVAGLASQSKAATQVTSTFTGLVQQLANDSSNTSKMAFISVCVAANTAGTTLMGF